MFVIAPSSLHPLSHLVSFCCSPALSQRMSSTSINLSSSLANNIFMMHNYACIFVSTPNPPTTGTTLSLSVFFFFSAFLVPLSHSPFIHPPTPPSSVSQEGAGVDGQWRFKNSPACLTRWGELWTQEHQLLSLSPSPHAAATLPSFARLLPNSSRPLCFPSFSLLHLLSILQTHFI